MPSRPRLASPAPIYALTVALLACAGESRSDRDVVADIAFPDAPGADTAEVTTSYAYAALCDRWAEARCRLLVCEGSFVGLDLCIEESRKVCESDVRAPIQSHVDLGSVTFDEDLAESCLGAFINASCDDVGAVSGDVPAECAGVLGGSRGVDEACDFDPMCLPGLFCAPGTDGTCPGSCKPRAVAGESCDAVERVCADGLLCLSRFLTDLDEDRCGATSLALGAPCLVNFQCDAGLYCGSESTCAARHADGGACEDNGACLSGHCDLAVSTCAPIPSEGDGCTFFCATGFVCTIDTKICVAQPTTAGDACLNAYFGCGLGTRLQCDPTTTTCQPFLPIGATCGGSGAPLNCEAGYCDGDFVAAGTCRPYRDLGQSCSNHGECGPLLRCGADGTCGLGIHPCRGSQIVTFW